MPEQAILILGAGGHGRVLASALQLGGYRVIGFLDAAESTWGSRCLDLPVFGNDERLADFPPGQVQLANGIGSVGLPALRRRIFGAQRARGYNFPSVIHPRAIVSPDVELGHGVQVMAGAVIQTGARIGDNVIVNTGAIVDHDCVIGAHCHVAPGAVLSGGVSVGDDSHIGTGAVIIQGIQLGEQCVVGAGAVVIRNHAAASRLVGVPAKRIGTQ